MLSKGQVFTPDFAASVVIFSFFLITFGVIWNIAVDNYRQEHGTEELRHRYSFSLLKTSGEPEGWNESNVEVPGLFTNGQIDERKILEFGNVSDSKMKRLIRAQNFYVEVEYLDGERAEYNSKDLVSYSSNDIPSSGNVYVSRTIGVLKNQGRRAELRFYTWK